MFIWELIYLEQRIKMRFSMGKYWLQAIIKCLFLLLSLTLLCLVGAGIALNVPSIQKYVDIQVSKIFSQRLSTHVQIEGIGLGYNPHLSLDYFLILDKQADTLLSLNQVKIKLGLYALWNKKVQLQSISWIQGQLNLTQKLEDTNYDFLLSSSDQAAPSEINTSWTFDIQKIFIQNLALQWEDEISGTSFRNQLEKADINIQYLDFFLIRLDIAIPIRKPYLPQGQRWTLNTIQLRNKTWRKENLIWNLAIGYPF